MKVKNNLSLQKMNVIGIIILAVTLSGCNKEQPEPNGGSTHLELTILGDETRQTIHSFGASDAWSCQFIGKNWPNEKKEQIADWLFSTQTDDQFNPKGIGLSSWRFNIGAGSAAQFGASGIGDEWRRAESFLTSKNTYDWSKQQGQRWFLQAAKDRGVQQFIGFVNSPPTALTKNGKAFSSDKNRLNLAEENYPAFANYLANISHFFENEEGILLNYISPINEPQWDWTDGGQEGSPAQNSEIADLCRIIDNVFTEKNVSSKIEIPESAQLNYLYENDNKTGRGNQIHTFFDPSSENYLGNLNHIARKVAGHSYYTTWPIARLTEVRSRVALAVKQNPEPIEFWMSEYCVLENNSEIKGNDKDLLMNTALYTSRIIFADLVLANAASWQWWLAVSPYNYKDGLVYTDYNKNDGALYDSKLLWAFGNFSRFIIPGMKRVAINRNDGRTDDQSLDNTMATAFVSDDKSKVSVVLVNYRNINIPIKIILKQLDNVKDLKVFLTDGKQENNLSFKGIYNPGEIYEIPANSVMTITNQE